MTNRNDGIGILDEDRHNTAIIDRRTEPGRPIEFGSAAMATEQGRDYQWEDTGAARRDRISDNRTRVLSKWQEEDDIPIGVQAAVYGLIVAIFAIMAAIIVTTAGTK